MRVAPEDSNHFAGSIQDLDKCIDELEIVSVSKTRVEPQIESHEMCIQLRDTRVEILDDQIRTPEWRSPGL